MREEIILKACKTCLSTKDKEIVKLLLLTLTKEEKTFLIYCIDNWQVLCRDNKEEFIDLARINYKEVSYRTLIKIYKLCYKYSKLSAYSVLITEQWK